MALPIVNKKKLLSVFVIIELLFLLGLGYYYFHSRKDIAPQIKRVMVANDRTFNFDSFVIPVQQHDNFSYVSLSIDFKMPNKELEMEMVRKQDKIRRIIYDILIDEINCAKELSMSKETFDQIKKIIIHQVNAVVTKGRVNEVYLRDFLAV